MRWQRDDGGSPRWASVIEQCSEAVGQPLPGLRGALRDLGTHIAALPTTAHEAGVDADVIERQLSFIEDTASQLDAL